MVRAPDELATTVPDRRRTARAWLVAGLVSLLTGTSVAVLVAEHHSGQPSPGVHVVQVKPAAPSVATGSADLIVESNSLTSQGSRTPLPADLVTVVSGVPGVGSVRGVVRGFNRLGAMGGRSMVSSPWNGQLLPTVVVSWDDGYFQVTQGRGPVAAGEVAVNAQVGQMLGIKVGDTVRAETAAQPLKVVGIFSLRGTVDLPRLTLLAAPIGDAESLAGTAGFTRLDVTVTKGQSPEVVRAAIASRLGGSDTASSVSQLGTVQQLEDELLIQRAYFDLLSPDGAIRAASLEGGQDNAASKAGYQRYAEAANEATLRIQRFAFIDADHAQSPAAADSSGRVGRAVYAAGSGGRLPDPG